MENSGFSSASERLAISSTGPQHDHAWAYAALVSMVDAVYCVDTAGRFIFVNTAFEAMTGYALADLQGTPSTRLYVPEAEALFMERRRQVYSGAPVSPSVETVLLLKDKRRLPVELSVSSLIMEGRIIGRVGVLRDITERKAAEQALRESGERFRMMADNLPLITDITGCITFMNAVAEELTVWPAQEALGQPIERVFRMPTSCRKGTSCT